MEDGSGGLSEPLYFDFVNYCAWKVAARQLRTPSARSEFSQRVAQELLAALWPQGRAVAQAAAQASSVPGAASEQAVVQLVTTLLEVLQSGNYLCRYQLVWGEHPGGWPQDWMVSQPTMAGAPPSASSPAAPDTVFQVKLHRPADLEGCVALRSEEEDGWWGRTGGKQAGSGKEPHAAAGATMAKDQAGRWGVSLMISLLLKEAGYSRAEADEFFYQDAWQVDGNAAQVRGLENGASRLLVLSCKPNGASAIHQKRIGATTLIEVPVASENWGRLDSRAPWEKFARGAAAPEVVAAVADFSPQLAFVVDWSALPAWRALRQQLAGGAVPPMVWLNYRVFSRTESGPGLDLVHGLEAAAMQEAVLSVALSRSDKEYLEEHVAPQASWQQQQQQQQQQRCTPTARRKGQGPQDEGAPTPPLAVLLCALREDMRLLPPTPWPPLTHSSSSSSRSIQEEVQGQDPGRGVGSTAGPALVDHSPNSCPAAPGSAQPGHGASEGAEVRGSSSRVAAARPYLTCVVRLVPEKEPVRFVELVEGLVQGGQLSALQLTPLMVAPGQDEYAQALKARLRRAAPNAVILEEFLGPQRLAELYSRTRLNVHPATADAFGMTIVEAAAQGAPSLVHDGGGSVGATDLLRAQHGEVFLTDLTADTSLLAAHVASLLGDEAELAAVGQRCSDRARAWSEAENARALLQLAWEAARVGGVGGRG
ncbi:hypothetical protein QJQ45_025448 [Haematococcus lacustris]|nr:hypothetical protein QJQ45_025448 [Haematococcus lacustris]